MSIRLLWRRVRGDIRRVSHLANLLTITELITLDPVIARIRGPLLQVSQHISTAIATHHVQEKVQRLVEGR